MRLPYPALLRMALLSLFVAMPGSLPSAYAHDDDDAPYTGKEKLGNVSFAVSCNIDAQIEFNRSMALFHSFWFDPAIRSFRKVLAQDPGCGMAQWGIAFMSVGNPFAWPANPKAMQAGANAITDAEKIGARSERERAYISALAVFFRDWENVPHRTRAVALQKAMEALATQYPDDDEAQILHALILDATALPTDKTFANQLRAAAILEPMFRKHPDHPGVAHYLIHSYDYAELAEKGLPSARIYAEIAPSVPHALHMPSHIYSRIGLWPDMVAGNRRSYQAAKAELADKTLGVGTYDALHAMDYMVFGELQQAREQAAAKIVQETASIQKVNVENFPAAYAFAAIPSRFALERRDWQGASRLQLSPASLAWEKFPQAEAILVFSRALGAARIGDIAAATRDQQRLEALKAAMVTAKIGYWPSQTDFQIKTINAWIALAERRNEEALRLMREAADMEEASDKHPVTPGNVVTSRQLLAEMLMEAGKPAEALDEFRRSLARDPNRYHAIAGAAHAALAVGDKAAAQKYFEQLLAIAANADTRRAELAEARAQLRR